MHLTNNASGIKMSSGALLQKHLNQQGVKTFDCWARIWSAWYEVLHSQICRVKRKLPRSVKS